MGEGGLCATGWYIGDLPRGYPMSIQSYHPISREEASNSAQSSLSSLTPLRKGGLSSLLTQGKPPSLSPGLRLLLPAVLVV